MKRMPLSIAVLVACGGTPKKPVEPPPVADEPAAPAPEAPKPAPAPPPAPKVWRATVTLEPVKGAKQKAFSLTYRQEETQDTASVMADGIGGFKPGSYHLVVHEGAECGPNATKAGAVWGPSTTSALRVVIEKDLSGGVDATETKVMLDGDDSIVGHTLVLHEDKKGKPGKALACGSIAQAEDD